MHVEFVGRLPFKIIELKKEMIKYFAKKYKEILMYKQTYPVIININIMTGIIMFQLKSSI